MKNIILSLILLFSVQLYANVDSQALTVVNNNAVLLNQKLFSDQVEFTVVNHKGKIVYEQSCEMSNQLEIVVDLGMLSEGEYHIEMADRYKIVKMGAQMNSQGTLSLQEHTDMIYKPQFTVTDSYIDVHFKSLYQKTKIMVTDTYGNPVYLETINNSNNIEKRYNIKNLTKGFYKIILEIPNHRFIQGFEM